MGKVKAIAKKPEIRQEKFWKSFYMTSMLAGITLMIFEVWIYRSTIIDVRIPLTVIGIFTWISYLLIEDHYKKLCAVKGFFFPLMQAMLSFGFIACYTFMAINYYGADDEVKSYEFYIKEKSSMSGSKGRRGKTKPLVLFDYFGFDKELVFGNHSTEKVYHSTKVYLTVKSGAFGYDVIESYDVR